MTPIRPQIVRRVYPLRADSRHHGTIHGYTYYACRCDECRTAGRDYMRQYRKDKAGTLAPEDPRHGTLHGYTTFSCRCQRCTASKRVAGLPPSTITGHG